MRQCLEDIEGSRIGKDDPAQSTPVDAAVGLDHLRPVLANARIGAVSRLQHLVADAIGIYDHHAPRLQRSTDCRFSRADSTADENESLLHRCPTIPWCHMFLDTNQWERRFGQIVKATAWLTLVYAVTVAVFRGDLIDPDHPSRVDPSFFVALAASGVFVIAITVLPRRFILQRRSLVVESVALIGSALTMTSVGFTGGPDSTYVLLSFTPILFGGLLGTFRIALVTAAFSGSLLLVQSIPFPPGYKIMTTAIPLIMYILVGLTFSQARRLLVAEALRATATAQAFEAAKIRLSRLEHANDLLTRLSTLADSRELNPIEVGDAALEGLTRILPVNAGMAALASDQGPVIVARRGVESPDDAKSTIPLRVGDREVGVVIVNTDEPLTADEIEHAEESLRPVALAFANVQLLQDIARRAIQEERARLARELHDEIGPSLASLGLAVDLAILQNPSEPALSGHLQSLRDSVGGLVEEIRATVADLREDEQPSLIEAIKETALQLTIDDITVEVILDERRPPRPSVAGDIAAVISESLRNAVRHAGASKITIEGICDFDSGEITVLDDGTGFEPSGVPAGHFGLIGMRERADKIGASLEVSTGKQGTAVTISWGSK